MLVELRVRDLGVIADLDLVIGPGMTALTGETGAGKTLVVEALELLLGGRADTTIVRAGASEAVVEGRFVDRASREVVLSRAVPATGRSRAYVDGRMAPASLLSEIGDDLVDLHGQHVHQSLLHQAAQRDALDGFAGVRPRAGWRARERELAAHRRPPRRSRRRPRALARTVDLLRFQVDEIAAAAITAPDEDEQLAAEESVLGQIGALRTATRRGARGPGGIRRSPGPSGTRGHRPTREAVRQLSAHDALSDLAVRLRAAQAERRGRRPGAPAARRAARGGPRASRGGPPAPPAVRGAATQVRPEARRRARVRTGEPGTARRTSRRPRRQRNVLGASRQADVRLREAEERLGAARRKAAPKLAAAVEAPPARARPGRCPARGAHRRRPRRVGGGVPPRGEPRRAGPAVREGRLRRASSPGPCWRPASCSRPHLRRSCSTRSTPAWAARPPLPSAVRSVRIGRDHQVLVVTHLAQVAAFADQQVLVSKSESGGPYGGAGPARQRARTASSSSPGCSRATRTAPSARRHAKELLATAARSVIGLGRLR